MRWVEHVAPMWGGKRDTCRLLVEKPEEKIPQGKQRRRWVDNINMNLVEMGWGGVDWVDLVQDSYTR
jgi:hypothetical protein